MMRTQITIVLAFLLILPTLSRDAKDAKGLSVGDKAPLFTVRDATGNTFSLGRALEQGPVVMIFYRGHWCPVCNKHLGSIQDSLTLISGKGVTVVAISPEKPELLDQTTQKTGASFTLLYDEGYRVADAYDVVFQPDNVQVVVYNVFLGANLKEAHSDNTQQLPIPATYIIGTDGKIAWRQFDPNYKNRSSVKEIISALESIK